VYDTHDDLKRLVADTDRHFTYIGDSKLRGAVIDIHMGDIRKSLKNDEQKRFALLIVELIDKGFDPEDRLTLEAVKLYMDRVAENGIVALHVSNKVFRLEPIVAAIATELKIAGRIWNDGGEGRPGKTACSWVVLSKTDASLGILGKSTTEQVLAFGTKNLPLKNLLRKYGPNADAKAVIDKEWNGADLSLEEFGRKYGGDAASLLEITRRAELLRNSMTIESLTKVVYGPLFHPLIAEAAVGVRRDGDRKWPKEVINENSLLKKLQEGVNPSRRP
jgi:hypothetical protein